MHDVNGKPLAACSFDELNREREILLRKSTNLTKLQRDRLIAIERELDMGAPRSSADAQGFDPSLGSWR